MDDGDDQSVSSSYIRTQQPFIPIGLTGEQFEPFLPIYPHTCGMCSHSHH